MELTATQYKQIEPYLPRQRGNVTLTNLQVLNAILYVTDMAASGAACPSGLATGTPSIPA